MRCFFCKAPISNPAASSVVLYLGSYVNCCTWCKK